MNYELITCLRRSDWSPVVNWDNMHPLYITLMLHRKFCHHCITRKKYADLRLK